MSDSPSRNGNGRRDTGDVDVIDRSETFANQGRAMATMAALRDGRDAPDLDDDTASALGQYIANTSTRSATRARIKQMREQRIRGLYGPGRSHNGRRDYWETFGYPDPRSVAPEDYETRAKTQDVAKIVAEAPVDATWKYPPIIRDDGRKEGEDPTQFEKDVQTLLDGSITTTLPREGSTDPSSKRSGLNTYWEWADRKQRPVQYGILFMGYRDGREMTQPVNADALDGPDDLAYCNVFSQSDVTNWAVAGDDYVADGLKGDIERPDVPILYEIEFKESQPDGSITHESRIVHHSRVHHILEKPADSEWLGESCFTALLHRLIDFEKGVGSSVESHYANVDRKYIGMGDESGMLDEQRTDVLEQFDEQMQEMVDGMRTTAYTENMDMEIVGGEAVDPSGMLDSLWPFLSGVSGQPQRIMKGSERGDLASSQDDSNWASEIAQRQERVGAKRVVIPTIEDFIRYGVVTEPEHEDNSYTVSWKSQFELNELEEAEKSYDLSRALKNVHDAISTGADPEAAYAAVGLSHPDSDGQVGSGGRSSDAATNIDETNPEVQDQFEYSNS